MKAYNLDPKFLRQVADDIRKQQCNRQYRTFLDELQQAYWNKVQKKMDPCTFTDTQHGNWDRFRESDAQKAKRWGLDVRMRLDVIYVAANHYRGF